MGVKLSTIPSEVPVSVFGLRPRPNPARSYLRTMGRNRTRLVDLRPEPLYVLPLGSIGSTTGSICLYLF